MIFLSLNVVQKCQQEQLYFKLGSHNKTIPSLIKNMVIIHFSKSFQGKISTIHHVTVEPIQSLFLRIQNVLAVNGDYSKDKKKNIYIYIYIYTHILYIYIYTYIIYMCMHILTYICV